MKEINIENATEGMILAKPIYDEKNRTLINDGAILTANYLQKLIAMGVNKIYVATKETEGINIEDSLSIELRNKAATSIQNLDIPTVLESAKEIVECMCESADKSLDLLNIRNSTNYAYHHAVTVAEISIAIGKVAKDENGEALSRESLVQLAVAALLHDIGKRCVDKKVLEQLNIVVDNMPYREDFAPIFAYNLLKENPLIDSQSLTGILFHQMDENGMGFPAKVDPNRVPVFSKIIHIADTYDTLISKKIDGKQITSADAVEYLMAYCDTKFNRELVSDFIRYIPLYPKGSYLTLSNGMKAIVYENTVGQMMRPSVILEDGRKINLFEHPSITIIGETVNYEEVSNDVKSK